MVERIGHLGSDVDGERRRHRLVTHGHQIEHRIQRGTVHVLHYDVGCPAVDGEVVDLGDGRVVQQKGQLHLIHQALPQLEPDRAA
jgi:hypothetical protein